MKHKIAGWTGALSVLLMAAACEYEPQETYDHDSSENCVARGYKAGTPEYNKCRHEEQAYQQMLQEREQLDEQKRQQEFYNNTRTRY